MPDFATMQLVAAALGAAILTSGWATLLTYYFLVLRAKWRSRR
jgi:hypothetical protein